MSKRTGVFVLMFFIGNIVIIAISAPCISDDSEIININEQTGHEASHVDIGLSSSGNLWLLESKDSCDCITKQYSLQPCKVFGLNFGPHTKEWQDPNQGIGVSEEQIRELLGIISPFTDWIRIYSCVEAVETVNNTSFAHELGFKVACGVWLSNNLTRNEKEISCAIDIARAGDVDLLIVGSEVIYRNELTENQLIEYINEVKTACAEIPVAYADVYYEFFKHPKLISAVDVVMPNYYPFTYGAKIDYAVYLLHLWHREVVEMAEGKPVIVSETGWPSEGESYGEAVSSLENASFYFQNFVSWALAENVSYFYFEAFDEPWKARYESPGAAHLGIWDKEGNLKPGMERVFDCKIIPNNWEIEPINGPGDPAIEFTDIPRFGSLFDDLSGRVSHVKPGDCRVAVYTKIGDEWWTKPPFDDPRILIWPDGKWSCMITPGKAGAFATKIVAYLLPYDYSPPILSGESTLPSELDEHALAMVMATRPDYKACNLFFQNILEKYLYLFPTH